MTPRDNPGGSAAIPAASVTTSPATSRLVELFTAGNNDYNAATLANIFAALLGISGVAAGYKIARGQATTVAASDTIVTGLATVVAVIAVLDSDPVAGCQFVSASIGDQAGTPAAGSVLIKTWKATASGDTALIAATTFTKKVNWIAIGL